MHLRPLPEDRRGAFRGMVDHAFRPEDGPDRDRDDFDLFTPLGFPGASVRTTLDALFPRERVFFGEGF